VSGFRNDDKVNLLFERIDSCYSHDYPVSNCKARFRFSPIDPLVGRIKNEKVVGE